MKLRITYILLLLLGLTLNADAQKKSKQKKAVKAPAKKTAKAPVPKKGAKKPAAATKQTIARRAEKDTLKGATIEIIQSYKPEVRQAPKPESVPGLPPIDTATASMNFKVPPQSLEYTYNALPLRALALTKDSTANLFRNYVKAGGGNLGTLLFDAGIGALQGKNYNLAIHASHLSQKGNIQNQKSSLSGLEADAIIRSGAHEWNIGAGGVYNQYFLYGYDDRIYTYIPDQLKIGYTGINVHAGMQNIDNDKALSYNPTLNARTYSSNRGLSEYNILVNVPFTYRIDTTISIDLGVNGAFSQLTTKTTNQQNNIFQFAPGLQYRNGVFEGYAGLAPTIGSNNTYLLPDVRLALAIKNTQLKIFAGWKGTLKQNTLEQMTMRNPYLFDNYVIQQTHADEIYGGVNTNIGNHITFNGRVSWWQYDNMPLFVNDTATDNKQFVVAYDKVTALSLQGSVRYNIASTMSVGFTAAYTTYNTTINRRAWHEPGVKMTADLVVRPAQNLVITANFSVMDEMYALDKGNRAVKLNGAFDLGGGAEYSFVPRLGAFVQVNNIFNNAYERWYGYRVYGFNILGGLRLKF